MEELEKQIRGELIRRRADEIYGAMEDHVYQNSLMDALNSIDEEQGSGELMDIISEFRLAFSIPEMMLPTAFQSAAVEYMTREQIDDALEKDGLLDISKEAERACGGCFGLVGLNDSIVAGLVDIAKKDGIYKAKREEAEHEVTRSLIPAKEEYIASQLRYLQEDKACGEYFKEAMVREGISEPPMSTIEYKVSKAIEEGSQQFKKDTISRKADKIYGA